MSPVLRYILTALIAYLLGSLSTGLVLAKLRNKPDLREVGSKNTGATNALRVMGLRDGILVFLGDVAKALLACWIGQLITGRLEGAMLAGILVIVLGVLGSWLGSLTMYGFGELVERAMNIDDKLSARKPE